MMFYYTNIHITLGTNKQQLAATGH